MRNKERKTHETPLSPDLEIFLSSVIAQTLSENIFPIEDLTDSTQAFYYLRNMYLAFTAYSKALQEKTGKNPLNELLSLRPQSILETYFTSDLTVLDMAEQLGSTKQNIHQMISRSTEKIYENLPPLLKEQFSQPFPKYFRKFPQTNSSNQVVNRTLQGKTAQELHQEFTHSQVSTARVRFAKRGIKIPYLQFTRTPEFLQIADTLQDKQASDEEIQKALDTFTDSQIISIFSDGHSSITTLKFLVREAGFHIRPQQVKVIHQKLREMGVPLRVTGLEVKGKKGKFIQRYYFIAKVHKERVLHILMTDEAFQDFRPAKIKVLGKPDQDPPNTVQFLYSSEMFSLWQLLKNLPLLSSKVTFAKRVELLIDENCPVSLYKYGKSKMKIFEKDRVATQQYFSQRIEELKAPKSLNEREE